MINNTTELRLLQLRLTNFKGVESFYFNLEGRDADVYGTNGAGKTTLFDAFTWVLFGKDSLGQADFEIKRLDANNEAVHGLEHSVEATLLWKNETVTLKKVYSEKWTKKRGSAEAEFTGHTVDHFIDGVPVKKGEYEAKVAEIMPEKTFKMLTIPAFFADQLPWQERRKVLLEMCGVSQDKKMGDRIKVLHARRTEINRELEKLPVRIDEVNRGLPPLEHEVVLGITQGIKALRDHHSNLLEQKTRMETGGEAAELTKQLAEVQTKLYALERQVREETDKSMREARQKALDAEMEAKSLRGQAAQKRQFAESLGGRIVQLDTTLEAVRAKWKAAHAQTFAADVATVCPTCEQDLPEHKIEAAREKAQADFNRHRGQAIEAITAEGQLLKKEKETLAAQREGLLKEAAEHETQARAADEKASTQHAMAAVPSPFAAMDIIPLTAERDALEVKIAALRAKGGNGLESVKQAIADVATQVATAEAKLARIQQREQGLARIAELKAQQRTLGEEYQSLEQELYAAEQELRATVRRVEEQVNGKFTMVSWKMFNVLINGGIEETCEALVNGVPYSSNLNTGTKINAGLDIINALATHYGFVPPVWVDHVESVVNLLHTRGQMIRLIVSGADKHIRVKYEGGD